MQNLVRDVALGFVERSTALGLKGKRRDQEALSFFVGAMTGLQAAGFPDAASKLGGMVFLLSVQGYRAIERVTREAVTETA